MCDCALRNIICYLVFITAVGKAICRFTESARNCTFLLFTWQPEPPLALLNKVRVQEIFLEIKAVSVFFCFSLLECFQKPVGSHTVARSLPGS